MSSEQATRHAKVVIVGAGPAGLTAAIYAGRALLEPVVFCGLKGSQLLQTTDVENFPGFPGGILGPDLIDKMTAQATEAGATFEYEEVHGIDTSTRPLRVAHGWDPEAPEWMTADTVIIATGAAAKRLDIPGTGDGPNGFWQRGVSACAVCDGAIMAKDTQSFVIGGGDAACEEALYLTKFASEVHLVVRRDALRASVVMANRVKEHPKIQIHWNSNVKEVTGGDRMEKLILHNSASGEDVEMAAGSLFFAIGHNPVTNFLPAEIETHPNGYLKLTQPGRTFTSVPGIFAAGDVSDHVYRQAVVAAGRGAAAAIDAERWLAAGGFGAAQE